MQIDSIVRAIIEKFETRAAFGKNKYGTTLDRTDLNLTEWIQHLQDELHDAYLYSEKLKQDTLKKDRLLELSMKYFDNVITVPEAEQFLELKEWFENKK